MSIVSKPLASCLLYEFPGHGPDDEQYYCQLSQDIIKMTRNTVGLTRIYYINAMSVKEVAILGYKNVTCVVAKNNASEKSSSYEKRDQVFS
jgi:hypothetical protein